MTVWNFESVENLPSRLYSLGPDCPFCKHDLKLLLQDRTSDKQPQCGVDIDIFVCDRCGWWKIKCQHMLADRRVLFYQDLAACAKLLELKVECQNTPIEEIRTYLIGKYEQRFKLHPRMYEETVGSVFGSLGYEAVVTGYQKDDGIDVILQKDGELIGIQVKKWKESLPITVAQIRELNGSLVLGGLTKGMFVTTSRYQSGCEETANRYAKLGYPIELINAEQFFDQLCLAQRSLFHSQQDFLDNMPHISLTVVREVEECRDPIFEVSDDYFDTVDLRMVRQWHK